MNYFKNTTFNLLKLGTKSEENMFPVEQYCSGYAFKLTRLGPHFHFAKVTKKRKEKRGKERGGAGEEERKWE